jgi:hypothetical protein
VHSVYPEGRTEEQFSLNGSNTKKFWKTVKENKTSFSQLPMSLTELFNHHFIKSGFLFDSAMPPCPSNISSSPTPSNANITDALPSFSSAQVQSFSLQAVSVSVVLKELLKLDPKKTFGSDGIDPFFFFLLLPFSLGLLRFSVRCS